MTILKKTKRKINFVRKGIVLLNKEIASAMKKHGCSSHFIHPNSQEEDFHKRLELLSQLLLTEGSLTIHFLAADHRAILLDTLLIDIPATSNDSREKWRLECSFIPDHKQALNLMILNCFVAVYPFNSQFEVELLQLLNILNTRLPLGSFIIVKEAGIIGFRTLFILPDDNDAVVKIVVSGCLMAGYLLTSFVDAIAHTATGDQTAAQALTNHPLSAAFKY
jgi:hypothetical protein